EVIATLQQLNQVLNVQRGLDSDNTVLGGYVWDIDDKVEREWCVQWLVRIVKWATEKWMICELDEWERVAEMAAKLTCELCGKGASGAVQRRVPLWRHDGEPLLLGGIALHEPRSGTGLLGLAAGCALRGVEGASVTMTDYLPVLIQAAREGAQSNGLLDNGAVVLKKIDWFEMAQQVTTLSEKNGQSTRGAISLPAANYMDAVDRDAAATGSKWEGLVELTLGAEESKGAFDLVIAADVLYEVEHCYVIALLANHLLAATKSSAAGDGAPSVTSRFILTTPLRSTHWREVTAFEAEMAAIPTMRLVSKDDTTRADDLHAWVSGICDERSATVLANDRNLARAIDEDVVDSLIYRIYTYERC
ncbi:hypothetical protein H4S07_004810, partial [Coemansia furcata]